MAGQTGIAGSTKIGRNCMFAGQVGVAGHISVADGTKIGAQAGIAGSVKKPDTVLIGSPAIDYHNFMKSSVVFKKLPEMKLAIDKMEKESKQSDNQ
jgi:UDP-3-O-[3-hydroxymyristoyl] glucosamine N-acyltransferase